MSASLFKGYRYSTDAGCEWHWTRWWEEGDYDFSRGSRASDKINTYCDSLGRCCLFRNRLLLVSIFPTFFLRYSTLAPPLRPRRRRWRATSERSETGGLVDCKAVTTSSIMSKSSCVWEARANFVTQQKRCKKRPASRLQLLLALSSISWFSFAPTTHRNIV